jgi:molybdopterin-guanine dinucleotide biosynthesis protein B
MLPIVSIVGHSKSGKTTLIEKLIVEFKKRGYRVAAVKHSSQDFDMDKRGKDTWRYAEAGSDVVAASTPQKLTLIKSQDNNQSIDEILRMVGGDCDLVIIEGFHSGHAPKIEVHRKELNQGLRCSPDEIKAVVTDEPIGIDRPQFGWEDISGIADFIIKKMIGKRGDDAVLLVNGCPVALNQFARQVFVNALVGIASTLKGVDKIRSLDISIRKKGPRT